VLRAPARRLLGTHPRENLIYTPVKLEVSRICPSAPEAEHHVKQILLRASEISIYFATGELESS
jgi:hypothetical protein